ncbi:helix-turn-helix domain-containing protein [Phycisphaerales bacterium ac7]
MLEPDDQARAMRAPLSHSINVNRPEAAKLLGISLRSLDALVASRRIPHQRIGARVVFPLEALRRWSEDQANRNWKGGRRG